MTQAIRYVIMSDCFNQRINMSKVVTTEYVLAKCREVHGDTYEYLTTNYVSAKVKLEIFCKVHSEMFYQTFSDHKNGQGCPKCGIIKRNNTQRGTLEDFIVRANKIHNNSYEYGKSLYTKYHGKLIIGCRVHGEFIQSPAKHLSGQGCPICAKSLMGNERMTTAEFIARAKQIFGDTYDYSISKYIKSDIKLDIICKTHGKFCMSPNNHLAGKGCSFCASARAGDIARLTLGEFISKANEVHNYRYTYPAAKYDGYHTPLKITCGVHGNFSQQPANHLLGNGCPSCSRTGFDPNKTGHLYVLRCGDMTKVGITNLQASKRASKISKSYGAEFVVIKEYKFEDGSIPDKLETLLLRSLKKSHKQPTARFEGHSECFYDVNLHTLLTQIETLIGELNGN